MAVPLNNPFRKTKNQKKNQKSNTKAFFDSRFFFCGKN